MSALKTVIVPIHREGYIFITIFAVITAVIAAFSTFFGWVGLILTCWCIYFFRDPNRVVPDKEGVLVSPGDGVVQMITEATPPPELELGEEKLTRISIFLNVFNVHVNRVPIRGTITRIYYFPGKFFNASLDKASIHNERNSIVVETDGGKKVLFVQIAGLVARRIKCYIKEGDAVETGSRYGIIRFGSRVDVYLPEGVNPLVSVGQQAIGGETILADLNSNEEARSGTVR